MDDVDELQGPRDLLDERGRAEVIGGGTMPVADEPTGWSIWQTAGDVRVCPLCAPLHGAILGEAGDARFGPPRHARCRCRLYPIRWEDIPPHLRMQLARASARAKEASVNIEETGLPTRPGNVFDLADELERLAAEGK